MARLLFSAWGRKGMVSLDDIATPDAIDLNACSVQ